MTLHTDMVEYYARRAADYEAIYARPERQADLAAIRSWLRSTLAGQRVLEVACGTGYWTAAIADCVELVQASDISPAVLAIAQSKQLPKDRVSFSLGDALTATEPATCSACLAAFWWSHVLRDDQGRFLASLRQRLGQNALLVMVDNVYVEGTSTPIARTDLQGNTFQIRRLPDGTRYEVLKNFPSDSGLRKRLGPYLKEIRIQRVEHYWMLSGRLK